MNKFRIVFLFLVFGCTPEYNQEIKIIFSKELGGVFLETPIFYDGNKIGYVSGLEEADSIYVVHALLESNIKSCKNYIFILHKEQFTFSDEKIIAFESEEDFGLSEKEYQGYIHYLNYLNITSDETLKGVERDSALKAILKDTILANSPMLREAIKKELEDSLNK